MTIVDKMLKIRKTYLEICFDFTFLSLILLLKANPSLTQIQSKFQDMFFALKTTCFYSKE